MSAFCEPETTTSTPQASVSSGMAPRLEIASQTTSASPRRGRQRLHVADDAGRGLGLGHEDDRRARSRRCARAGRRRRASLPTRSELCDVAAVRARDLAEALAEVAGRDDEHALAGRAEIGDRRLHPARTRAGVDEDVVLGSGRPRRAARAASRTAPGSRGRGGGSRAPRARPAPAAAPASAPASSGNASRA